MGEVFAFISRWCCLQSEFYGLNGSSTMESVVSSSGGPLKSVAMLEAFTYFVFGEPVVVLGG